MNLCIWICELISAGTVLCVESGREGEGEGSSSSGD